MRAADLLLALRAAAAAAVLPGTVTVIVPALLLRGSSGASGGWRSIALLPLAIGAAGLFWCIADFARLGRGTLAPLDPPRFVVRGGLYRWVRNPMYVCVALMLLSEAALFGSWTILAWVAAVIPGFHLFVVLFEEPDLRRRFGADYEAYRRAVPRWIPRPPRQPG